MCNSLNCLLVFLGVKEGIDELLQQPAWCPQEGKYAPLRGNGRAGPSQSVISHVLYSFSEKKDVLYSIFLRSWRVEILVLVSGGGP